MKPRQLESARYLGLEGRDSPRGKVVSVHVNGSHRDISVVRDNFVDRAHAFLSKRDNTTRDFSVSGFLM